DGIRDFHVTGVQTCALPIFWVTSEQSAALARDAAKRAKIADELADVVIYALEFANITGLDVAASIEAKMAANAKKYPVEKAKGRSEERRVGKECRGGAEPVR